MKKLFLAIALVLPAITAQAQEKFITTSDGVELFVKVKGKGTPVLYLHGGPGSGSKWFEEFFGEFMEEHFTMIYFDQRGVGRSGGDGETDYSMERMALDFEELRKELGYKDWLTLGHSFGGVLQMGYAELYPEATKGMLMMNCTLYLTESFCESWGPKAAEFTGRENNTPCSTNPEELTAMLGNNLNALREKNLFWKMAYKDPENEKIMDASYANMENWNGNFSNKALSILDYWKNYKPNTSKINMPVLFFYGTKDWMVGPDHYQGVDFPNLILWKSEVGHMPFLENKEDLQTAVLSYKTKYRL